MEYLGESTVILSGRSMHVIANGQSSEAHEINDIIYRGSLLILLYINDLPKNIQILSKYICR